MAICKHCHRNMDWGKAEDGWIPLVPIAEHDGLDRTHLDEDGVLRAAHYQVCTRGGPVVHVTKLPRKVKAKDVAPTPQKFTEPDEHGECFPVLETTP